MLRVEKRRLVAPRAARSRAGRVLIGRTLGEQGPVGVASSGKGLGVAVFGTVVTHLGGLHVEDGVDRCGSDAAALALVAGAHALARPSWALSPLSMVLGAFMALTRWRPFAASGAT